jgi:virginiamycin A acetyltransferase
MGAQVDLAQLGALGIASRGLEICEFPIAVEPPLFLCGQVYRCHVGKYAAIHPGIVGAQTVFGRYSQVAAGSQVGIGGHPTNWLSTHYFQYRADLAGYPSEDPFGLLDGFDESAPTSIGNDCWIGAHCFIKAGVTIGDGAIVGAGSVVTGNVPPYAIVGGVPARVIRYRFEPDLIAQLLELRWWQFARATLNGLPFNQPARCVELIRQALRAGTAQFDPVKYVMLGQ